MMVSGARIFPSNSKLRVAARTIHIGIMLLLPVWLAVSTFLLFGADALPVEVGLATLMVVLAGIQYVLAWWKRASDGDLAFVVLVVGLEIGSAAFVLRWVAG